MHLCRLIISQRSVMGWSQCYCAVGLNRNTFSFTADPRTAVNEDLSQIFPISPHQTGTPASCLCPWGSFILALLEEKCDYTSRLMRNYTLEPPSHHICGLDIPYQRSRYFLFSSCRRTRPEEWQNHCLKNAGCCTSITVFIAGFSKRC